MERKRRTKAEGPSSESEVLLAKIGLGQGPPEPTEGSDRAFVLVAAATLERILEQVIRHRVVPQASKRLFDAYGPLSSFAAKIDVAHAFGLLSSGEREDLHRIRQIRNEFAHEANPRSFATQGIRDRIATVRTRFSAIMGKPTRTKTEFHIASLVLQGFLLANLKRVRRIRTPRDPVAALGIRAAQRRAAHSQPGEKPPRARRKGSRRTP